MHHLLSIPCNKKLRKKFLQQLEEDLFFAQSLAITRNEAVFFNHYFHQQSYSIRSMNGDVILTRKLPSHVTILQGHMSSFWFTSTGSINKFGHMYIQTNNKVYRLFFSIGKGRFEIYEEENWLSTK